MECGSVKVLEVYKRWLPAQRVLSTESALSTSRCCRHHVAYDVAHGKGQK